MKTSHQDLTTGLQNLTSQLKRKVAFPRRIQLFGINTRPDDRLVNIVNRRDDLVMNDGNIPITDVVVVDQQIAKNFKCPDSEFSGSEWDDPDPRLALCGTRRPAGTDL